MMAVRFLTVLVPTCVGSAAVRAVRVLRALCVSRSTEQHEH